MQDAAIERLSKIISNTSQRGGGTNGSKNMRQHKPLFRVNLRLEEGWFSLFLLATVVYSTIWCVQAVGWVDHLNVLTLTTAFGLVAGVIAAKQKRLPSLTVHVIAAVLGLLLAYWQTAGAFYSGNTVALANGMHHWVILALNGGTSEDDSIFLFFITALGFVLAYTSAWLVFRTRSPWLVIVANAVVLLINLSNIDPGFSLFLVVFLMASLLLLLRFNLFESVQRWRRQGLRYADDLGWDVMQAGALISIGILIFSWFLPSGYTNDAASQIWSADANPWVQLENTWNRVFSISGGNNPANHGNFRDTLVLGGNPNLSNDIVFVVKTDDATQYLELVNYAYYDGRSWTNGPTDSTALTANEQYASESPVVHPVQQQINVVNPPGEQNPYLLGASQISSTNQASTVQTSKIDSSIIAFLARDRLVAGEQYKIVSVVSSADEATLRTVPFPVDAPNPHYPDTYNGQVPLNYYNPAILHTYLQLPTELSGQIRPLALQETSGASTMYDKAKLLEAYLHNNFQYEVNIHLPPGLDAVQWFLFTSHQGYCNYFATAMAAMARSLGMPARVAVGYTNGQLDPKTHLRIIRGTDAHMWTQIYFAGYGWINFEPSAGFISFDRPIPGQYNINTSTYTNPGGNTNATAPKKRDPGANGLTDSPGNSASQTPAQEQAQLREEASITLGSVILLILFCFIFFSLWWRRLFRRYGFSAQIYGRICLLANWAGIEIQRSQTPFEYIHSLAVVTPSEAVPLERFSDIYVRELWADPESQEHPRRTGEVGELPALWHQLQPRLFLYVVRHPYFLRVLPSRIWKFFHTLRVRRRARKAFNQDLL